jgi:hypothetical protein
MIAILVLSIGLGCLFFVLTAIRFVQQLKEQEIDMAALRERRHQQREQQQQQQEDLELGIKHKRIHRVMDTFQFHTIAATPNKNHTDDEHTSNHSTTTTTTTDEDTNAALQHKQQQQQQQQQQEEKISTKSQSCSPTSISSIEKQQEHSIECCICLDAYDNGQVICSAKTTECNHIFHQDCAIQWFQHHNQCPLCRVTLIIEEDPKK